LTELHRPLDLSLLTFHREPLRALEEIARVAVLAGGDGGLRRLMELLRLPHVGSDVPCEADVVGDDPDRLLDVANPAEMKGGLDQVSLANFVAAARGAVERSGATLADVGYLCGIHMKPSMHRALVAELGLDESRAAYLDDTGHMSGVDPLLALDRAARAGDLREGELVLLLAAGTGYTWAASVVRWGDAGGR